MKTVSFRTSLLVVSILLTMGLMGCGSNESLVSSETGNQGINTQLSGGDEEISGDTGNDLSDTPTDNGNGGGGK
ncbi:hypothetical protein HUU42_12625 [bacterium]|nr:hypothetical protein [bacterium]